MGRSSPWLFCITIDEKEYGNSRDGLMAYLAERGIETRPFFMALHHLPPFRERSRYRGEALPVTDRLSAIGMTYRPYSGLKTEDIGLVCEGIKRGGANAGIKLILCAYHMAGCKVLKEVLHRQDVSDIAIFTHEPTMARDTGYPHHCNKIRPNVHEQII